MNFKKFIGELKRRNVFRSAITYLVVAWLITQVSAIVLPAFNASHYMKTIIFLLILGFPISLIFAWVYQLSPKGIKRIKNIETEQNKTESIQDLPSNNNKKLVVLPFQNTSTDKDSNYFSDGLTEEIIIRLAGIKDLDIASRSTSMKYKDSQLDIPSLGRELNARYLLQGTVRKFQDDLKISTALIDIEKDSQLWADIYHGKIEDIFGIQEQVSKKIAESLQLKLTPKEKLALGKRATSNSQAYDANLKAREFLLTYTKSYLLLAIELFQNAIDLDPKYAAPYAGMAEACALLYETHDKNIKWIEKAEDSSLKALLYDPTSSEAYSALGLVYYNKNLPDEALVAVEKAISFDPDNFFAYWVRGRLYRVMDRDFDSVSDFKKVLELNKDFHSPFGDLQMAYERLHDKKGLQEIIERAVLFYPNYLLHHPDDSRARQFYAFTLKRLGRIDEAKKEMQKGTEQNPDDPIIVYNAACFYSLLDDKKAAVENLKKAIEIGFENYNYVKHDPDLACLQNEPDFIELMKDKG